MDTSEPFSYFIFKIQLGQLAYLRLPNKGFMNSAHNIVTNFILLVLVNIRLIRKNEKNFLRQNLGVWFTSTFPCLKSICNQVDWKAFIYKWVFSKNTKSAKRNIWTILLKSIKHEICCLEFKEDESLNLKTHYNTKIEAENIWG